MRPLTAGTLLLALAACEPAPAGDVGGVSVSDVHRFVAAWDGLSPADSGCNALGTYWDSASTGLETYRRKFDATFDDLCAAVQRHPDRYARLANRLPELDSVAAVVRDTYARFDDLRPLDNDPAVYLLVGTGVSAGSTTGGRAPAILLGVERIPSAAGLPWLVAHELAHTQQRFPLWGSLSGGPRLLRGTVLRHSIAEGSADFIAGLVTGREVENAFAEARESELWTHFQRDAMTRDYGRWLYNGGRSDRPDGWPPDLGYWVGYRITKAYYDRAPDKREAIEEILSIRDFERFMLDSGYRGVAGDDRQESIGDVSFATSCAPESAEPFNHAVALLHHMTYPQARAEFAAIAESDPRCAMAHWGVAMTLFQPLWPTRPTDDDLRRGREAVETARAVGAGTERERMFVEAAGAFFDPPDAPYWDRIAGWAERTGALRDAYPDDIETAAFFALSHLAVAPTTGGLANNREAAAVLAEVLRRKPDHPGGIHYTIHANDADGRQGESLDVVARYSRIAPRNPHALHMPTHIYVRLGDWERVIAGNREAALAALEHPAGDEGQWVWDEFPHALEYMVYAMLQVGDDEGALEQMRRLQATADLQPGMKTAFHLASIPARYALERRDWPAAAALEPRSGAGLDWDLYPWPEAVTWFARAVGAARLGDVEPARQAVARLSALRDVSTERGEELFARQTRILRLGAEAWLARLEGHPDRAVALMREAVELEATTPKPPVTPAPTLPAIEQLGDLLLELDRPAEALEAYEESLRRTPGRLNSARGAARAAERAGEVTVDPGG